MCHNGMPKLWMLYDKLWNYQSMLTFLQQLCMDYINVTWSFNTYRMIAIAYSIQWINGWVNNGEAGDLRGYRDHYDVTEMYKASYSLRIVRKCQCHFSWYVDTHQPLSFIIWMTITPEIYVCLSCHHRESPQNANNANIVSLSFRHYLNVHDDVIK